MEKQEAIDSVRRLEHRLEGQAVKEIELEVCPVQTEVTGHFVWVVAVKGITIGNSVLPAILPEFDGPTTAQKVLTPAGSVVTIGDVVVEKPLRL